MDGTTYLGGSYLGPYSNEYYDAQNTDSGNVATGDNNDQSWWAMLIENGGSLLTGAGNFANSFTGKQQAPVTNYNNTGTSAVGGNTIIYVGVGVALLVVLLVVLKMVKK